MDYVEALYEYLHDCLMLKGSNEMLFHVANAQEGEEAHPSGPTITVEALNNLQLKAFVGSIGQFNDNYNYMIAFLRYFAQYLRLERS